MGIFDSAVNPIDRDFNPIELSDAMHTLEEVSAAYPAISPSNAPA
jgi:hypothetical protein